MANRGFGVERAWWWATLEIRRGMGKWRPRRERAGRPSQAFCMHAESVKRTGPGKQSEQGESRARPQAKQRRLGIGPKERWAVRRG